ncbi:hypothetical protein EV213_11454 [Aureibacillus halotolerans]|uniref:Uncharacterized protein n=1 Tax=Aureibacillus halotolerans TaxID=1508390 RepID=A0A4R6TYX9_9BACI|nr:hypothetical protein EV213_11454 [Aureibacillus halotolerans]
MKTHAPPFYVDIIPIPTTLRKSAKAKTRSTQ